MVKKLIIKILAYLGYEVSKINKEGTHLFRIKNFMSSLNTDLVLDVGANIGQFAKSIRKTGYDGEIISFEPLSEVYDKLIKNSINDKKWKVYPKCAIGSSRSEVTINVSKNLFSSSVLNILDEHVNPAPDSKYIDSYLVDQIKLDDLDFDEDFNSVFLKIDVQGYELDVLKGATKLLDKTSLIKVEISYTQLYDNSTNWRSLVDFLNKKDFEIWDVENGFRNPNNYRLLQSDLILVNKKYV
tara:strand:+ start:375 stop:1097 length:723 start_codon:yes stop_codon:yes gene_type:complete